MRRLNRCIILVTSLLIAHTVAWGQAPTVEDVKTVVGTDPSFLTQTISALVASGTNRGIAVCVTERGDAGFSPASITFNGSESFTKIVELAIDTLTTAYWYLPNPTATTADVVITMNATETFGSFLATAISIANVLQSEPTLFNTDSCPPDTCVTVSADLTTTAPNTLLFTCSEDTHVTSTWTHGPGQIERSELSQSTGTSESHSTSTELKVIPGVETLTSTSSFAPDNLSYAVMGVEPFASGQRRRALWQW